MNDAQEVIKMSTPELFALFRRLRDTGFQVDIRTVGQARCTGHVDIAIARDVHANYRTLSLKLL